MATIDIPQTQQKLNKFAAEQWDKTLAYLQGQFSLSRSDCEDIFQDSFLILYKKIIEGELTNLTSSLSTYFIAICRNKAFEKMRSNGSEVNIIDEYPETTKDEFEDERIDRLLSLEDDTLSAVKDHLIDDLLIVFESIFRDLAYTVIRPSEFCHSPGVDPVSVFFFGEHDEHVILGVYVLAEKAVSPFLG